jgi:hypothetical protein
LENIGEKAILNFLKITEQFYTCSFREIEQQFSGMKQTDKKYQPIRKDVRMGNIFSLTFPNQQNGSKIQIEQ